KPVIIEEDVWIACNSIILRGVTIGKCSVIGAGSVVTKDVPAWTIVAGNPARIIGKVPEGEQKILNGKEVVSDRG
ncbi:MAG: DapH/DapD/GlmU-related protein, partial [Cyanobacteriota bacterium]